MKQTYFFADEAGCFSFTRAPNVSKYFILCTVHMENCAVAGDLLQLRHELARRNAPLGECFHASTDKQVVRDEVFDTILQREFTVRATIMEKSKAQPQVRVNRPRFYKYGWYYHFKHGTAGHLAGGDEPLITAASIGTKKERLSFHGSVEDVMRQTLPGTQWATDFCPAMSQPCLQAADYCAWAIQRKWERGDTRSYDLIKDRITNEYDLWSHGTKHFY